MSLATGSLAPLCCRAPFRSINLLTEKNWGVTATGNRSLADQIGARRRLPTEVNAFRLCESGINTPLIRLPTRVLLQWQRMTAFTFHGGYAKKGKHLPIIPIKPSTFPAISMWDSMA